MRSPTRRSSWFAFFPGIAPPTAPLPPLPSPARSFANVVLATAQPPFSSPIIADWFTRASEKNTSLKSDRPGHLAQRPHLDARLVHLDGEVR